MSAGIVILGGRERGAHLLEHAVQCGVRVDAVSPMHLYPDEQGVNDRFLAMAKRYGVRVVEPELFASKSVDPSFASSLIVCENWRRIISEEWNRGTAGVWIFHESPLPRYRGFAPLAWQILNAEKEFGVTLFHAAPEMDAGDVIGRETVPILPGDDCGDLYAESIDICSRLLMKGLSDRAAGIAPVPQNEADATYTVPLIPEDAHIDWNKGTDAVLRLIRAFAKPYSGAWCMCKERRLYIWKARAYEKAPIIAGRMPGRVLRLPGEAGIRGVCTADGVVVVEAAGNEGELPGDWSFSGIKLTLY